MLVKNSSGEWVNLYASPGNETHPTVVEHGSDSTVSRPTVAIQVQWVGTVNPANAQTDDQLLRTDYNATYRYDGANWKPLGVIDVDTTYQIPTDYSTLQAAIDDLASRVIARGIIVTLNIETGHALTDGVVVVDNDYSMFRITSADASVSLDAAFPTVHVIEARRATMPRLECLIDAGGLGDEGVRIWEAASGYIGGGSGVINAASSGLNVMRNSRVYAKNSRWTGADADGSGGTNENCIYGADASILDVAGADADQAASGQGLRVTGACMVFASNLNAQNNARHGIRASYSSHIQCLGANASGNGAHGIFCDGVGTIYATGTTANNNSNRGVAAFDGGFVRFDGDAGTGNGGADDILVARGGHIAAQQATGVLSQTANSLTSDGVIYQ